MAGTGSANFAFAAAPGSYPQLQGEIHRVHPLGRVKPFFDGLLQYSILMRDE